MEFEQKQIIHTTSLFAKDESFKDERFMRVRIAAMHTGKNRNNSRFTKKTVEKAKSTFANIPVLADVREYEDEDGNKYLDYSGHSMHIEDDAFNEDMQRVIYDEKVVGIIPETNNFELVYDDETGNFYVYVDALLYRSYGNYVCDILESRGNITDVSMEIGCNKVAFSAKEKCLDVEEMTALGVTLLGQRTRPGMIKSHAKVFSLDEDNKQTQLIQIMQELKESLDNYTTIMNQKTKEGGNTVKFEELLKKYGKTKEDITFEYESMSDKELEAKFEELFGEDPESNDDGVNPTSEGETSASTDDTGKDNSDDGVSNDDADKNGEGQTSDNGNSSTTDTTVTAEIVTPSKYSVTLSNGTIKEYALSLSEIQSALYSLVNEMYADADNTWYGVDVFEDNQLIMHDYYRGTHFRQAYGRENEKFTLSGDRVEVFANYLTKDEENAINELRSNYSVMEEKIRKYELSEEKAKAKELLESDVYSSISDTEEYKALVEEVSKEETALTYAEVEAKADAIIVAFAKKGTVTFASSSTNNRVTRKELPSSTPKKKGRYGNFFSKN